MVSKKFWTKKNKKRKKKKVNCLLTKYHRTSTAENVATVRFFESTRTARGAENLARAASNFCATSSVSTLSCQPSITRASDGYSARRPRFRWESEDCLRRGAARSFHAPRKRSACCCRRGPGLRLRLRLRLLSSRSYAGDELLDLLSRDMRSLQLCPLSIFALFRTDAKKEGRGMKEREQKGATTNNKKGN